MTFSPAQNVIALIVTHNPSGDIEYLLEKLFSEFDRVILVDNGSKKETRRIIKQQVQNRGSKIKVIFNHQNLGVATALNQGFSLALKLGCDFLLTLDQDSAPTPSMVETLLNVYDTHPETDRIAIVAPMIDDPEAGIQASYLRSRYHFFFERKKCSERILENVSMVITSGSMHNLRVYEKLGSFRDDFFIDYVDTEYCFRAKQHRFNIVVACDARLHHKLGAQKQVRLGPLEMRPTFHSVSRWYYISRNRIPMIWMYGFRFPHWLIHELIINIYGFFRMLLFEDHKLSKILAILLGSLDGLVGKAGEISESRARILSKFEQ